jgi:hypothetical protein
MKSTAKLTHWWRIRKWLPERYGQPCKIVATGRMNSILVEFEDGVRVVTCRYFVRCLEAPRDVPGSV